MQLVETLRRLREQPRLWRILVASAFVIPVLLVLPNARSLVVRNAVITAYLSDFRAPIDGVVSDISVQAGSTPEPGQSVLVLQNDRIDQSRVARLRAESRSAMDEAEQAKLALSRIQGMARDRSGQVAEYDRAIERDLKVLEAQLQKQQVALDATFVEAQSALSRVRHLLESGLSSQADLELAVADFEAARTRQLNNREEIQRLDLQWEELRRGIYQIDAQDGALFTRQMEQSLQLQLLEAERALRHAEAASQSKDAELERAQRALDLQTRAEIVLPEYKSVFDIYTSEGAWVPRGTRIVSAVDCSHLLIDIELDDALLQLVEPGQQVEVRVFGSFKRRSATVVLVRGSAALSDSPVLAAAVKDRGTRKGRVLARIDSAADDEDPVQTCQIGRTAYAEFEDIGLFTLMFYPLFR